MAEYSVRAAETEDAYDILDLIETVYPEGYPKSWADEDSIEEAADSFVVAEDDGGIIGCKRMNDEYWPGVVYLESLMVHPDHRGEGLGGELIDWIGRNADNTTISLDRSTSASIFMDQGYEPAGLLPEREFFGDDRESLMVTYNNGDNVGKSWDRRSRTKSRDGEPYLVEITGEELSEQEVREVVEDVPPTYTQIISREPSKSSGRQFLQDQEMLGGEIGYLPLPDGSGLNLSVYIPEEEVVERESYPGDLEEFRSTLEGKDEGLEVLDQVKAFWEEEKA